MNKKKLFSFAIVAVLVAIFCVFIFKSEYKGGLASIWRQGLQIHDTHFVEIGGKKLKVDLALTPDEQEQGLSGRKNLEEDAGMLFIFLKPSVNYFWMKDMNFPIDIIWIDQNFKIIYIKKDALPSSYPTGYGPGVDNQYVLEVSAGFLEKNNVKEGDFVKFLP